MLLPAAMLVRRADEAQVIGAAVTVAARGRGRRRIVAELGVPEETVRGWLRRFAARPRPGPGDLHRGGRGGQRGSGAAGAGRAGRGGGAVAAAAAAIGGRWPRLLAVSPWEIASAVTSASLLMTVITARAVNTNWSLVA
jgi:hypothetical protein